MLIIIAHKEVNDAQLAFDEAEKLKGKGVEIISVATGSRKKIANIKSQLQVISTTSTNTHTADYTSLWTILDEVMVNVCGLGQCTSCKLSVRSRCAKWPCGIWNFSYNDKFNFQCLSYSCILAFVYTYFIAPCIIILNHAEIIWIQFILQHLKILEASS